MRTPILLVGLLALAPAARLAAQTDYYLRAGATGWGTLVHDFIAADVDTKASIGPLVAVGLGHSIAPRYRAGVELILRQLQDLLRKRGVTPIEALGTDFDPRVHQAVSQESSSAHRDGEVMEELQRGYMLGDRLLRPAMVKVATS